MKYHIVKRTGGEPAQIISTHDDRDEALGLMEDYVREVMAKKNGEDRVKLIPQVIKEAHYYQNKEYVADAARPKLAHKFPLMDVSRHYGPESSEWGAISLDAYFCVRSREDLFRLSVYHKKETRGVFRNGWTTVKLFDIEIVLEEDYPDQSNVKTWNEIYEVYYDGKDMGSVSCALVSDERDAIIQCLIESEEFQALKTESNGFEPVAESEETKEEEVETESETNVKAEESPYYPKDN